MTWYPRAEIVPWRYPSTDGRPTFYRGQNKPIAVVLHVMQGHASTARQWAMEGHYGASWHFTVSRTGHVMQHMDFKDGGYHAGITDAQAVTNPPTWALWKGPGINVNRYSLGIEHEGFVEDVLTDPRQRAASKELCHWLAGDLGIPLDEDHFPPHAAIDTVNRRNDFATPERRAEWYRELFNEEEKMTDEQLMEALRRIGWADANGPIDKRLREVEADRWLLMRAASAVDASDVERDADDLAD